MNVLSLLKYHGLGNDFLVALDGGALDAGAGEFAACAPMVTDDRQDLSAGDDHLALLVRALCDRHTGIGADGVLIVRPGGALADVGMELRNSDGGRAETSGNGLRCFVLATIEAGLVGGPEVVVETDVGARRASLRHREGPSSADVSVEMGRVKVARSDPVADVALPGSRALPWPAWAVDVGNPHFVLLAPSLEGIALAAIGPTLERRRPGGQNVEFATYEPVKGELFLSVWERGAGITLACGSGSVAAAAAFHSAGISPAKVLVHNPGGTAEVSLSGDDPVTFSAELAGPVHRVARFEVDVAALSQSTRGVSRS